MESTGGMDASNLPSQNRTGWISPSTSYPENHTPSAVTASTPDTFPGSGIGSESALVVGSTSCATHASGLWSESLTPSAGEVVHTASTPTRTLNAPTGD